MNNQQIPPHIPLYVQPETQNAQYPLIGMQKIKKIENFKKFKKINRI